MNPPKQPANPLALDSRYATTRRLYSTPAGDETQCHGLPIDKLDGGLRGQGYFKHGGRDLPLITVITIVHNGEKHLEQTIRSIIGQTYSNVEYIVIDGGSSDNTLSIIRRYEGMIDYWLSEPDKGIADAMNKGLGFATGDYVIFLHADDYLENCRSLDQAAGYLENQDIVMFDILYGRKLTRSAPRGFNFWMNFKTGVYHQAVLCRRSVFDRIGGFDTGFKIAMDYDFFLRAYRSGIAACRHPVGLSVMRDTGISSRTDWPALRLRFDEEKKVHEKNCNSVFMACIYFVYWHLYLFYRLTKQNLFWLDKGLKHDN